MLNWYFWILPSLLDMAKKAEVGLVVVRPAFLSLFSDDFGPGAAVPGRLALVGGGGTGRLMVTALPYVMTATSMATTGLEDRRPSQRLALRALTSDTAESSSGWTCQRINRFIIHTVSAQVNVSGEYSWVRRDGVDSLRACLTATNYQIGLALLLLLRPDLAFIWITCAGCIIVMGHVNALAAEGGGGGHWPGGMYW